VFGLVVMTLLTSAACTRTRVVERRVGAFPSVPGITEGSLAPSEPPLVWIGGTLFEVAVGRLQIRDSLGSLITVRRLGAGATAFFKVSANRWERLSDAAEIRTGGHVCVQTLMDGSNLLALRVFLGATCGPA